MTQDRTMTDEPLPIDRDDLHDRLLDRALREKLGAEKAPDLSEKIVAAARPVATTAAAIIENPVSPMPFRWGWLAIAASLLVVAGGLIWPALNTGREAARRPDPTATADPKDSRVLLENGIAADDLQMMVTPHVMIAEDAGALEASEGEAGESARERVVGHKYMRQEQLMNRFDSLSPGPVVNGAARGAVQSGAMPNAYHLSDDVEYSAPPQTASGPPVQLGIGVNSDAGIVGGNSGEGEQSAASADFDSLALSTIQPEAGDRQQAGGVHYGAVDPRLVENGFGDSSGRHAQQLLDLEVMKQVAIQQASSSSGLEAAVAAEMDKDPTMDMYKEQLFALDQQIQQLAAASENPGDAQLSLLKGQYAQTDEMMRWYRTNAEREARGRLQGTLEEERRARIEEMVKRESERRARIDNYAPIVDNPFRTITADSAENRLSTFSIDVDTASYANVRQFLMQSNMLPPPDAVRIEELVNYFTYDYAGPGESDEPVARNAAMMEARMAAANRPFAANIEVAACPWAPKHRLVRLGIKGREVARAARPKSNLVFLVDVSGSMDDPQKLPLLVDGMRMLTQELGENDRVAIVVYASTEGLALESTRGDQQETILAALDRLSAGGSTAGGAGIQLAYKVAADNFIEGGTNRVILCTDGDFNVGVTDVEALKQLAADKAKDTGVFLTVLGFGRGNLNDELMEAVADNGNGAYHYVDNRSEARKVLVEQMTGTLVTIAKDVKIQVEFNPTQVAAYRLIGYENRVLAAEDFNNDAKDAGEIGAGHTVTALYEIVPIGEEVATTNVDELKYAPVTPAGDPPAEAGSPDVDDQKYSADAEASSELLTLKIRYKQPDGDTSTKLEFPVTDAGLAFSKASSDFQFASSVAGFGMLLRGSPYKGDATFAGMLEIAESSVGNEDPHGYRREFTQMIAKAKQLSGE
jgi:Ca-activated chloride channel family protein